MPRVDNQGVSIHYRVEGSGPPLILQHGFSDSIEIWYEPGTVAALKPKYRLVLIDAPFCLIRSASRRPALTRQRNADDLIQS